VTDPSLAVAQPTAKVSGAVLAALDRGETPMILVALDVPPSAASGRDLAALRREVRGAQDAVLGNVDARDLAVRRRFEAVPAFAALARNRGAVQRLVADPRVRHVELDAGGTGMLDFSVPMIRADLRHARGNRGAGAVIAILDTGIDTDHPDLSDGIVHQACFGDDDGSIDGTGFCPGGSDRQTGAGAAEDDAGHGTHVSGIVASNGTVSSAGVAPDAGIVSIKVLDDCSFAGCFSYVSEIVAALDYVIANTQLGVDAISMSLGTSTLYDGACDNTNATTMSVASAVNTLRTNGVLTIASAGNNGSSTQMPLPACVTNAVAVSAVDDADLIANFSNVNENTDLFAPGVGIVSLARGGGTTSANGTSMAAPHAAGCAALLVSAGDATTPAAIETRLETSPTSITDARNEVSLPRLDCVPDDNQVPAVAATNATVTVNEGATAANTGTFSDPDGDAVTLAASVGTVTPGSGTWSWSFATTDGPSQSATVTITASDVLAGSSTTTFALVVNNVAPTVSVGADATVVSGQSFGVAGTFSDPGVNDSPWSWAIDWGFGANSTGSTSSQAGTITASRQFCAAGSYTVRLSVTDKDNGTGTDDLTLTVTHVAVTIDVTPAQDPNSVNLGGGGLLPVAVLSTATFDATTLDPATVTLGDGSGAETPVARRTNGRYYASAEDVNGDRRRDLVLHFAVPALVANADLSLASTSLVLRGFLSDGCTNVSGSASVRVLP
jgi:subtilisin family serine protease